MIRRRGTLVAGFLLCAPSLWAAFGQNKVIAHSAKWEIANTEHFEIHYTRESEALVPRTAEILEESYKRVTSDLKIPEIKIRTPFFLFTNHNTFEENNIADAGEGTGGVTEAFKQRLIIYNNGTDQWLSHVIPHEFSHVCEFEILYGGFWRSARLLKSPLYPLWFMEGLAEYEGGRNDMVVESMYIRDAATSGLLYPLTQLHGFNHLKPNQVTLGYKQGAAAMEFLAQEYGREMPAELLRLLRERFEVPSIIGDLTGQDYLSFDARYREYLEDFYNAASVGREEPEASGERLTPADILPTFNTHPILSPDGRWLAYFTDKTGDTALAIHDFSTRETRLVVQRSPRIENLHARGLGRAMSLSPDGHWLAFIGEKEQVDYLYLYDIKRGRLRRIHTPFEQLANPAFAPSGDRLVLSAGVGGTNDLYEVTLRGQLIRRLTHSMTDESDPVYSPDGKTLVYSEEFSREPGSERRLAALSLTTLAAAPLTDLPGNETAPEFAPDGQSIVFVGEPEGVPDLYQLDLASGGLRRLTHAIGGNFSPSITRDGRNLFFASFRRGSQNIYKAKSTVWPPTAPSFNGGQPQPAAQNWANLRGGANQNAPAAQAPAPSLSLAASTALGPQFAPAGPEPMVAAAGGPRLADKGRPYRFEASTDLFFPVFFYSSTDGLFLATFWQASEYLGNHTFQTQLQYSSGNDFLDYSVQYEYKRFRPQFFIQASGQSFFRDFSKTDQRTESSQLAGVSYPLNRYDRIETAVGSIYNDEDFKQTPELSFDQRENIVGVSFIRDMSQGRYLGVTSGDRFRASLQISRPILGGDRDYKTHVFEYHHFQPTGRESALAFRGQIGVSTGESPQLFRLGGEDRLRGYSRDDPANKAARYIMTNLEWRVPLKFMDYTTFTLFPDFALKAIYGTLFTDTGYNGDEAHGLNHLNANRIMNSVGAGLRVPTFVLQTYPLNLSLDVAKRTDANEWAWYVSLGPEF